MVHAIKSSDDKASIVFKKDAHHRNHRNQELRKGCGLSQVMFDLHINKILEEWKLT
jgi:hypothetical protein